MDRGEGWCWDREKGGIMNWKKKTIGDDEEEEIMTAVEEGNWFFQDWFLIHSSTVRYRWCTAMLPLFKRFHVYLTKICITISTFATILTKRNSLTFLGFLRNSRRPWLLWRHFTKSSYSFRITFKKISSHK